jgi:bacterioferritin
METMRLRATHQSMAPQPGPASVRLVGNEKASSVVSCRNHCSPRRISMAGPISSKTDESVSRDELADLLNEDLSREYQAIIAYVVYSQVLKGAEFMSIASQLETHAHDELKHALILSRQIDYLGKMPSVIPKPVRTSEKARDMLRFDLDNENETIRNYRERVRQCEALGEFALAEQIRQILVDEQDHQIDLATALGEDAPDLSGPRK